MEQLSGLDGMFLHAELPGMPMTISPLTIYDPSTAPQGTVRFKDILQVFENGLHKASVFRRRLVEVPFNLDHPYWIEDPDFDIEFHVRHIALPQPGDWRQLLIQAARLQSRPIDRSRPLWEAYVIEGLNNLEGVPEGSFAILLKIHHAAMDGVTGIEVFTAMHDFEAKMPNLTPNKEPLLVEKAPTKIDLLGNAYKNYYQRTVEKAKLVGEGFQAYRRISAGKKDGTLHGLDDKVRTRFNNPVSAHRSVTKFTMPIADVKGIKSHVEGATINDTMLAVVSGAMRYYLEDKGEAPENSLVAGCPVDVRSDENRNTSGNILSIMNVSLRSDIDDPLERLAAIHNESQLSKNYTEALGPMLLNNVTQNLPPYLLALGARASVGLAKNMPPVHNTVITNVPGLQIPAYFCGAKMIDSCGLGPCMPHCGLFHTVTSLYDTITICTTACRDMIPDPEFYYRCMARSYDELKSATDKLKAPKKPRGKAKTKAKAS